MASAKKKTTPPSNSFATIDLSKDSITQVTDKLKRAGKLDSVIAAAGNTKIIAVLNANGMTSNLLRSIGANKIVETMGNQLVDKALTVASTGQITHALRKLGAFVSRKDGDVTQVTFRKGFDWHGIGGYRVASAEDNGHRFLVVDDKRQMAIPATLVSKLAGLTEVREFVSDIKVDRNAVTMLNETSKQPITLWGSVQKTAGSKLLVSYQRLDGEEDSKLIKASKLITIDGSTSVYIGDDFVMTIEAAGGDKFSATLWTKRFTAVMISDIVQSTVLSHEPFLHSVDGGKTTSALAQDAA